MWFGVFSIFESMTDSSRKYRFPCWLILPLLAVITYFLTEAASKHPAVAEKFYAGRIYPFIAKIISAWSSLLPFSLGDLFYIALIVFPFLLLFLVLNKKLSWKGSGKILLNSLAAVYIAFYFLWGFNYYRSSLNERLEIAEQKPDSNIFIEVFENLVEQINSSQTDFEDISKEEIDSLVEVSYKKWAPVLKLQYPAGKRRAKEITLSRFFAQAGISGYYGPFFNEVHINRYNLPVEYPFVLAHEKAHQLGITSEAEANFYAWVVCAHSSSKHLRYSANLAIFRYFLFQGSRLEQLPQIIEKLDDSVKADFRKIREHWQEMRNEKIDRAASKVNDAYLKTNKVEQGIQDYFGVVKFIMDFSTDSLLQARIQY